MREQDAQTCLRLRELSVNRGQTPVLRSVSLSIKYGGSLAIVGERGAGKTTLVNTLAGRLSPRERVTGGTTSFQRADLLQLKKKQRLEQHYRQLSFLPLPPLRSGLSIHGRKGVTVGGMLEEILIQKRRCTQREARELAIEMLELTQVPSPRKRMERSLEALSPVLEVRVKLAAALCCDPKLLVVDEIETPLSPIEQAELFDLLRTLCRRLGTALLLTTSDPRVAAETCQSVLILHHGVVMEEGKTTSVLNTPQNPYTSALLSTLPSPVGDKQPLPGWNPFIDRKRGGGCPFAGCCSHTSIQCLDQLPPVFLLKPESRSRCWLWKGDDVL